MPHISLLVKPASSLCNMRCRYCFYADEAASRSQSSLGLMTRDTAAEMIRQALAAAGPSGQLTVAFQGGEPTVAGLAFFEHFVEDMTRYNTARIPVAYAFQTNGLALDEAWAAFLARNRFLVGVSVDGDKALHDEFRVDAGGKGTWNRVQKNLAMLQRAGVACNLLCVVTRRCARSAVRVYHALQKTGVEYLQFIPCLDPLDGPRGGQPWSLTPEEYGNFLCALFEEWYRDWAGGRYTSVRLFEDYVELAMGLPPSTCATSGRCGAYFVVEGDGSVYPCVLCPGPLEAGKSLGYAAGGAGPRRAGRGLPAGESAPPCRMHRLPVAVSLLRGLPAGLDHRRRGHCAQLLLPGLPAVLCQGRGPAAPYRGRRSRRPPPLNFSQRPKIPLWKRINRVSNRGFVFYSFASDSSGASEVSATSSSVSSGRMRMATS